jgi:hypothetical protein
VSEISSATHKRPGHLFIAIISVPPFSPCQDDHKI